MSNFDIYPEFQRRSPLWPRLLLLGLSNAFATFLLCSLVLQITGPAGGVLLVVGLAGVPCVTATVVARSSARDRPTALSAAASAGYFTLLLAFGIATEVATVWALLEIFWRGPQFGA